MADTLSPQIAALLLAQQRRQNEPAESSRRFGRALLQTGMSAAPVQSPLEGLARALQGGIGGFFEGRADKEQKDKEQATIGGLSDYAKAKTPEEQSAAIGRLLQGDATMVAPFFIQQISDQRAATLRGQQADAFKTGFGTVTNPPVGGAGGTPPGTGTGPLQIEIRPNPPPQGDSMPLPGIPAFESGGRYDAVGPVANAKGQRAYGKYQVMDFNVGPWTKEILGQEMTPEQFLANPQAQDAVYKAKIGQYRQQTGSDQGAASMWFSGQPNPNSTARDVNGVNVQQYVQRTTGGVPRETQVAQGDTQPRADASGTPVAPSSSVPDVPRPQPSPEQIQKYDKMVREGAMTAAQARQALDQELAQEWTVQRENRRMQWQQDQENQRVQNKARIDLEQKAPMALIGQRMEAYEKELRPKADAARSEITSIHQVRQLLDAGAFTGMGADAQAWASRAAQALGIDWGTDMQANTAALQSAVGNRVLALVKNLGSGAGISNADREYASKIAGGEISVGEPAMRRILEIGERAARAGLKQHDAEVGRLRKVPGVAQLGEDYFKVEPAPTYEEWSKANPRPTPNPGATAPAPGAPGPGQPNIPTLTDPSQAKNLKSGDQFYTPDGRLKVVP